MKKSEILKMAKYRIENKQNSFICNAIEDVSADEMPLLCSSLLKWIKDLMQPMSWGNTLESWMNNNHPKIFNYEDAASGFDPEIRLAFRACRINWLDWMIQYWEEKGE